jgi:hypothetical protein
MTPATTAHYRNPKGHVLGAPWTFLLPDAEPARVLAVGRPSPVAREALARLAPLEVRDPGRTADLPSGAFGVVAVLGRAAVRRLRRDAALAAEVARLLAPGGALYADGPVPARADGTALPLAVTPVVGEPRTLAPVDHGPARQLLTTRGLAPPVAEPERLEGPLTQLVRGPLARMGWRRATLVQRGPSGRADDPPAWLREVAAASGVDLTGMRWALSASGRYRSRKVLLFLLDPGASEPRYVVKLPRHPDEGGRIEREAAALVELDAVGGDHGVDVPGPAFRGHVGRERLPVLGQTALVGAPLRTRLADGAVVDALLGWVADLSAATAAPAAPGEVGARLEPLLDRFLAEAAPSGAEREALRDAVATLAGAPRLPLVLEHGDLGAWNVLVGPGGRPAVLDWEAAERRGMPLWDALYLVRSCAASSAGRRGREEAVQDVVRYQGPFGGLQAKAVAGTTAALGLDRSLVGPLVLTCWMHRAVKESSRRHDGAYRRLVRYCVEHQDRLAVDPAPVHWRSTA